MLELGRSKGRPGTSEGGLRGRTSGNYQWRERRDVAVSRGCFRAGYLFRIASRRTSIFFFLILGGFGIGEMRDAIEQVS